MRFEEHFPFFHRHEQLKFPLLNVVVLDLDHAEVVVRLRVVRVCVDHHLQTLVGEPHLPQVDEDLPGGGGEVSEVITVFSLAYVGDVVPDIRSIGIICELYCALETRVEEIILPVEEQA